MELKRIPIIPASILVIVLAALLMAVPACRKAGKTGEEPAAKTAQHADHDQEAEAEGHEGHDHATEEAGPGHEAEAAGVHDHEHEVIALDEHQVEEYGIETAPAGPGEIGAAVRLPGEIVLNADRTVRVVPRVEGVVREVRKTLGDRVRAGEVLAVIESRELAEAVAEYLAAGERLTLAQTVHDREQGLREKNISAEQEFLDARAALAETRIQHRSAGQKLLALGLSEREIRELPKKDGENASLYALTAPQNGTIIERQITRGDVPAGDEPVFVIADLATVWADFQVNQKDLAILETGQEIAVTGGTGMEPTTGKIVYLAGVLDSQKRTALARVLLPNPNGHWRPGLYVTGNAVADRRTAPVCVPAEAVQVLSGETVVFVPAEGGFAPRDVEVGWKDRDRMEITTGLRAGEQYVARGAFNLKASLVTNSLGGHAGHGH